MEVLKTLFLDNFLPSIISSLFVLFIVLVFLKLFAFKSSALSSSLRFKLLELPVIKAFLVLLGLNLGGLKISWYIVFLVYGWGVTCFLWRWISYDRFKTDVLLSPVMEHEKLKWLLEKVEEISHKMNCKVPKVVIVEKNYPSPFILGFFRPLLIIPISLLDHLTEAELEALLAHEVAHLVRWDNLYIWQAVLLRDIMFFNPVMHIIYKNLIKEKEKNCDDLAISITRKPVVFAEMLLKVYSLMKKKRHKEQMANSVLQNLVGSSSLFKERVERILNLPTGYFNLNSSKQLSYYLKVAVLFLLIIFLFSVNICG